MAALAVHRTSLADIERDRPDAEWRCEALLSATRSRKFVLLFVRDSGAFAASPAAPVAPPPLEPASDARDWLSVADAASVERRRAAVLVTAAAAATLGPLVARLAGDASDDGAAAAAAAERRVVARRCARAGTFWLIVDKHVRLLNVQLVVWPHAIAYEPVVVCVNNKLLLLLLLLAIATGDERLKSFSLKLRNFKLGMHCRILYTSIKSVSLLPPKSNSSTH